MRNASLVSLGKTSVTSLSRNGNSLHGDLETKRLDQVGGLGVNLQLTVGVGQVQSRHLGNVLVFSFSLLLLQLEGDSSDGTLLDSLHQVGGVTSNLISQSLGWDLGNLGGQSLVGLKVQSQLWVETLNQHLGGSLDGFSSNATLVLVGRGEEVEGFGSQKRVYRFNSSGIRFGIGRWISLVDLMGRLFLDLPSDIVTYHCY